jgi:predicted O-methyltransferase YrrM
LVAGEGTLIEKTVNDYADHLLAGEDDLLRGMREDAAARGLPQIQVQPDAGRLLPVLVLAARARRVLEIGTLFGYSATTIARVLPDDGELVTLEVNPVHAAAARENLGKAGVAGKVTVIEGPAIESLERLRGQSFDFIFIDADKPSYPQYLEHALKLAHPGTVIVADNVWRGGSVLDPSGSPENAGIAAFNERLAANPELLTTIIPTRDGADAMSVSVLLRA